MGLENETGRVCVDLFDKKDGYPNKRKKALRKMCGKISNSQATVSFTNLSKGKYAAFAFHDEDNNGSIKKNWIGMPKEGVGASNNAKGRMGPPSFEAASFDVNKEKKTISIKLRYL